MSFKEIKNIDFSAINKIFAEKWKKENTFQQSLIARKGKQPFVFFEGPPSANGQPGIHHVMARALKDVFCRYKTQKGFFVNRRAGWDTHGLPVELAVEKSLNIKKEDIGVKISIEEYNAACKKEVMKYTQEWERLTEVMGYWVDMSDPYITYDNRYIETLWFLLQKLYDKGLLYKGYTIQPYSPGAGTGLSSHELNQPGCYRDVKDTTCIAMFPVLKSSHSELTGSYILAWTTTPWTLPSNTALCVGSAIDYVLVETVNSYSKEKIKVVLAKALLSKYFKNIYSTENTEELTDKDCLILSEYKGKELMETTYRQLIDWVRPEGDAFRVITGDFVSTEDGTGIVHIAPTFGADDAFVAKKEGIVPLTLRNKHGELRPMVDLTGKFYAIDELDETFVKQQVNTSLYQEFAGKFVKNAYDPNLTENDETLDVMICMMLKKQGLVFRIEKHTHNYPHCWRTDKPVLYYPLDSWFIKTTAVKEQLIALNRTITWKPESTGTGRFGKWLENLQDWNLSRSRYWGTPLPIWRTEDKQEECCIGSVEELYQAVENSVKAGLMKSNPLKEKGFAVNDYTVNNYNKIDLHRPYVDDIILVSPKGKPMYRESDLIDVWFDSGAMPFAQETLAKKESGEFGQTADFIAEGVDQTRGWFFTLHAIATMIKEDIVFKTVISNGLVLDKNGNKMSKRLNNAVNPFEVMEQYGADALRWYMLTNAQPWDNIKFDIEGVEEVRRKFFGTLHNTYSFFALYANLSDFTGKEKFSKITDRPVIDRWILSLLNSLIKNVDAAYNNYDVTLAGRLIQDFVNDNLSNWYVRLNRKRFWGDKNEDSQYAFETLYTCLKTVSVLMSPIAPFYADQLFLLLTDEQASVHLTDFPQYDESEINPALERQMDIAQRLSSMILALRRKVNIKVRQPLAKIIVPILNEEVEKAVMEIKTLLLNEVNVKELEMIKDTTGILIKKIKPDFKILGKKYGKSMKDIANYISGLSQENINTFEQTKLLTAEIGGQQYEFTIEDVEITTEDMPGWLVSTEGTLTVALDIHISEALKLEGIARELINRVQNIRKESDFQVSDRIDITIEKLPILEQTLQQHQEYIASQVLANSITLTDKIKEHATLLDFEDFTFRIEVTRVTIS